MGTITYAGTFTTLHCINCGVPFALDGNYVKERRRDHKGFCCPNGHSQYWPQNNEVEQARSERDAARAAQSAAEDQAEAARNEALIARRRAAAARGQVTKIKNRIKNGVCPAPGCKRHFKNVMSHIRTCHPEFEVPE